MSLLTSSWERAHALCVEISLFRFFTPWHIYGSYWKKWNVSWAASLLWIGFMLHSSHAIVDHINRIISTRNVYIGICPLYRSIYYCGGPKQHTASPRSDTFCPPIHIFSLSMKNSNDKEKKQKPAKHRPAVGAKAESLAKAKCAQKLTSKATFRKNHLQDDTDSEAASSDNEGGNQKEDIESVLCSQQRVTYRWPLDSWKDVELSKALISAITNDQKIKQALYLSPGSNVSGSKGGGKPKTDFHWQLCQILFRVHDMYGPALQKVEECTDVKKHVALKRTWGIKIKTDSKSKCWGDGPEDILTMCITECRPSQMAIRRQWGKQVLV